MDMYAVTTSEQRAEIRRCYREDGWSLAQIHRGCHAQGLEISLKVVTAICDDLILTSRRKSVGRVGADPALKAKVAEAAAAGVPWREIVREFHVSNASVTKWVRLTLGNLIRPCGCGCGQNLPPVTTRGTATRKYIDGHRPNYGAEYQRERRERLKEAA